MSHLSLFHSTNPIDSFSDSRTIDQKESDILILFLTLEIEKELLSIGVEL